MQGKRASALWCYLSPGASKAYMSFGAAPLPCTMLLGGVALPLTVLRPCQAPMLPGKVGESTERELLELRTKVSKQERRLQSTAERLKTANQQKESMEQFIVSQREIPKGSAVYSSLVTLAFQAPCKKHSHQKSLKQQERWACPPFVQLPIC
uniref:Uncharacterized protein n=1 Tax=Papio anubis TaxID=9555 RepID=A0A8I5NRQ2_PAPAN